MIKNTKRRRSEKGLGILKKTPRGRGGTTIQIAGGEGGKNREARIKTPFPAREMGRDQTGKPC